MAKIDDYTRNRMEGLAWALRVIEKEDTVEAGVEMLRKEIRFRNATFVPLEIPAERIRAVNRLLARRLITSLQVVLLKLFEDAYGWRKKRLQRLKMQMAEQTELFYDLDPYGERYIKISEYAEYFQEMYGVSFDPEIVEEFKQVENANREVSEVRVSLEIIEKLLKNSHPDALAHLKKELGR